MLSTFAYEAAGASDAPGIPCALFFEGTRILKKLGRQMRRENVQLWAERIKCLGFAAPNSILPGRRCRPLPGQTAGLIPAVRPIF
jgi:hypothetical protein